MLVAVNRLPGLQSSKQNLEKENEVYDGMMLDLIRLLVLPPLTGCSPEQGLFEVSGTLHMKHHTLITLIHPVGACFPPHTVIISEIDTITLISLSTLPRCPQPVLDCC